MRRAFFVCRITITSNFSEFANLETTCASLLERRVHRSSDRAAQPRRGFFENAHVLCALQAKHNEPVAMLMFDLDHFKSINDRFDHTAGDEVLRLFGRVVRAGTHADDIIARFGGEEFIAIVPGGLESASKMAEHVRSSFEAVARSSPRTRSVPRSVSASRFRASRSRQSMA